MRISFLVMLAILTGAAELHAQQHTDTSPWSRRVLGQPEFLDDRGPLPAPLRVARQPASDEITLPVGPTGEVDVVLVRPEGSQGETLPGVVYFHGGGWVLGNVERYAAKNDSTLVIHNAEFDLGFINAEREKISQPPIAPDRAIDTVSLARRKFPGAQANLDALCRRFKIDNSNRSLHGALKDARLLVEGNQ